jgi:AbiJ N-terminal domain 4
MLSPKTSTGTDVSDLIMKTQWFHVYDLIEALHHELRFYASHQQELVSLINALFERKGYAYKLTGEGRIEHRGDEAFDAAVRNADIALADAGSTTARNEIHKALEDLAKRPVADLSGAVQHAMAGLECIANQVAESSGLELGKVVKSRPDLFPPPLNEVVPKLYGYASNNGRHITEGGEPDFAEAELLVGTAAIVATYLARKLK